MSDVFNFAAAANELLRGARDAGIGYLVWGALHDSELEYAHSLMADLTEDQDIRHEAAMRRSEKLRAIGSEATFFSGLARIDGELRSVRVAVTPRNSCCSITGRTSIPSASSLASRVKASREW